MHAERHALGQRAQEQDERNRQGDDHGHHEEDVIVGENGGAKVGHGSGGMSLLRAV